jgi:hypothetical protein
MTAPTIVADFVAQTVTINGVTTPITDHWEQSPDESGGTLVYNGSGVVTDMTNLPFSSPAMIDTGPMAQAVGSAMVAGCIVAQHFNISALSGLRTDPYEYILFDYFGNTGSPPWGEFNLSLVNLGSSYIWRVRNGDGVVIDNIPAFLSDTSATWRFENGVLTSISVNGRATFSASPAAEPWGMSQSGGMLFGFNENLGGASAVRTTSLITFTPLVNRTFCPGGVAVTGGAGYHTDSLTATDNHFASCSFWHWDDGYDTGGSNHQEIMEVDFEGVDNPNSQLDGNPTIRSMSVNLKGATGQLAFGSNTAVPLTTGQWNHYLWSGNIATGACDFLVNGVRNLDTPSNSATGNIPWNGKSLDLFWDPDGNHHFDVKGRVLEYWLAPGQSLLNGMGQIPPETVAKFYSGSCPVDLGADGSTPTGVSPAVYLTRGPTAPASDFGVNRGTGGSLTTMGTPTAVDGPCACDAAAQRVQGHVFG